MGARNVGLGPLNLDYRMIDHFHRVLRQVQEVQSTIGPVYGDSPNLPNVYYVDSGNGSDTNDGRDPASPMATIDAAINRCVAGLGDVILVQSGHTETVAAAIAADIADISIIGVGEGSNRPQLTGNFVGDVIAITAANVRVENLFFNEATAAITADIEIGGVNATIKNCVFTAGANDDTLITISAGGDDALIEECEFFVTANGPDIAIDIEAAGVFGTVIRDNFFNGQSVANSWDEGIIESAAAHTLCFIENNVFLYMPANIGGVEFTAAATGVIRNNFFAGGTLGQMLDPGSCFCAENYESDAIDESGRLFPTASPDSLGDWQALSSVYSFAVDTGAQAAYSLFTVTGVVEVIIYGVAGASLTSGGAATIEVGVAGNTAVLIAQATAADLLINEIYHDATPTTTVEQISTETARRFVITNGQDIQFLIGAADLTAGIITFYLWWRPVSSDGLVIAS